MKKALGNLSLYFFIFAIILIVVITFRMPDSGSEKKSYTYGDLILSVEGKGQPLVKLEINRHSDLSNAGTVKAYFDEKTFESVKVLNMDGFMALVNQHILNGEAGEPGIEVITDLPGNSLLFTIIFNVLLFGVAIALLFFFMQRIQGGAGGGKVMSFGKTKAKAYADDKKRTTFDQVAGLKEEKAELEEIVDFLKHPNKYVDIGARIPKGILLVGPPGTGKTLLAKAIAGEAGVPFFPISGSDFVEMFVGVGASRVRDLFEQAKKNSPCLVFIDEIDAVGRRRGTGLGGGHDEREQTLNQLLVEMDGFGVNEGIIIIAASNRADILDPALLRPGRFDRKVAFGLPDVKGREEILEVHSKGKQLEKDVDLNVIARSTPGFTGADLENLMNEAALLSARENKKLIDMEEVRKAYIKVSVGTEKKSRVLTERERKVTAYHEVGHAIVNECCDELEPVHIVSIIPTGPAGGYTIHLPGEDKMYLSKKYMEETLVAFLGGRVAEEIFVGDVTTGASSDIERATQLARSMVTKYGMSEKLGPIQFGSDSDEVFIGRDLAHARNYGEGVATVIDAEIKRIIDEAYGRASEIINGHRSAVEQCVDVLLEREKITGDEFRAVLGKAPLEHGGKDFFGSGAL